MSKKHVILHHFYDQGIIQSGAVYMSLDFVVTYCQNYDGLPGQWAVGSYGKALLPEELPKIWPAKATERQPHCVMVIG